MSNRQLRHFCRNKNCRTKLAVPTDNHHKAFCSRDCYKRFYRLRCFACEKDLPKPKALCSGRDCRLDYRKFRHVYDFDQHPAKRKTDARSAHFTGLKSALAASLTGYRIIAGPALSPPERVSEAEWAKRDAADARYVAEDEKRLRNSTSV